MTQHNRRHNDQLEENGGHYQWTAKVEMKLLLRVKTETNTAECGCYYCDRNHKYFSEEWLKCHQR
jgi:hypothetical protein